MTKYSCALVLCYYQLFIRLSFLFVQKYQEEKMSSCLRAAVSGDGSMQILIAPDLLVATTTLLTHGVGRSTRAITPT